VKENQGAAETMGRRRTKASMLPRMRREKVMMRKFWGRLDVRVGFGAVGMVWCVRRLVGWNSWCVGLLIYVFER
jgi:hypothetical protein